MDVCSCVPFEAVTARISDLDDCDPFATYTGPVMALAGTVTVRVVDVAALGFTLVVPLAVVNTTVLLELMFVPFNVNVPPAATVVVESESNDTGGPWIRLLTPIENAAPLGCTKDSVPLVACGLRPLNRLNCVVQPAPLAI